MNKSSLKRNFSLPIINLSKKVFTINQLKNSQTIVQLHESLITYKNYSKTIKTNLNSPSSKLKKNKTKCLNNTHSSTSKQNIKYSLLNNEKSSKKVRLLKYFFSNNLFPKRLSSIKQEKIIIPIQLRNEYIKTIKRKNSLRFDIKYNSHFVREITSNFMIINYSNKKNDNNKNNDFILKKDETIETYDKFYDIHFEDFILYEKIKKYIILFDSHYKKITKKSEELFKRKENYINFIEDSYKIPYLKNKFYKLKSNEYHFRIMPINYIKPDIIIYLNKLRIDNEINNDKDKLKENEEIEKNNNKEEIYENEIEKLLIDNAHLLEYKEEERIKKNFLKLYEIRIKNFLHFKFNTFQNIQISNEKDRNAIFSIFKE